jgi:hypothetical protein
MMIALACLALAGGLFAYVFFTRDEMDTTPAKTRLVYLRERKEVIYENLRDLNFEYKAGKFSEQDFDSSRDALEAEAAGVLSEIAQLERTPNPS